VPDCNIMMSMESFIQSDIFFFITSVAVIVVTIFILTMLWYIIRILKNVRDVSEIVKEEALFLSGDISRVKSLVGSFFKLIIKKVQWGTRKSKNK